MEKRQIDKGDVIPSERIPFHEHLWRPCALLQLFAKPPQIRSQIEPYLLSAWKSIPRTNLVAASISCASWMICGLDGNTQISPDTICPLVIVGYDLGIERPRSSWILFRDFFLYFDHQEIHKRIYSLSSLTFGVIHYTRSKKYIRSTN